MGAVLPQDPCTYMVYTWASKGLLEHGFGPYTVYVRATMPLGPDLVPKPELYLKSGPLAFTCQKEAVARKQNHTKIEDDIFDEYLETLGEVPTLRPSKNVGHC